jgi:mono/diheme cytochrome c family protein
MNDSGTRIRDRRPLQAAFLLLMSLAVVSLALATGCGGGSAETSSGSNGATAGTPPATSAPPAGDAPATPAEPALTGAALGAKVFSTRCALCHGPDGHGDGPGSKALNPKPRNLHDQAYMSTRTDAQLLEIIHNGKGAMPKWGGVLSEAEITAVLAHVRELGKTP